MKKMFSTLIILITVLTIISACNGKDNEESMPFNIIWGIQGDQGDRFEIEVWELPVSDSNKEEIERPTVNVLLFVNPEWEKYIKDNDIPDHFSNYIPSDNFFHCCNTLGVNDNQLHWAEMDYQRTLGGEKDIFQIHAYFPSQPGSAPCVFSPIHIRVRNAIGSTIAQKISCNEVEGEYFRAIDTDPIGTELLE